MVRVVNSLDDPFWMALLGCEAPSTISAADLEDSWWPAVDEGSLVLGRLDIRAHWEVCVIP